MYLSMGFFSFNSDFRSISLKFSGAHRIFSLSQIKSCITEWVSSVSTPIFVVCSGSLLKLAESAHLVSLNDVSLDGFHQLRLRLPLYNLEVS